MIVGIVRPLIRVTTGPPIVAADIVQDTVEFVSRSLGISAFCSVNDPRDLIHSGKYEVIIVASLFSHLPLGTWTGWVRRLYEMLEDDGILVFSTQGPSLRPEQHVD
jgi:hypothetical protein